MKGLRHIYVLNHQLALGMLCAFSLTACSGFKSVDWVQSGGSGGGNGTTAPGPPPYEGAQFEPAGRVTAFNSERTCVTTYPELNQPTDVQSCTELCGELFPSFSSVSGPSTLQWDCYAPGLRQTLRDEVTDPPELRILVNRPVWRVAAEQMDPDLYWPNRCRLDGSNCDFRIDGNKSKCDTILPNGTVNCHFLTPLRIWRVFTCDTSLESTILSVEDSNLIERENDAACSISPAINAVDVVDTLPPSDYFQSNFLGPFDADVIDENDEAQMTADWRGDYTTTVGAEIYNLDLGVFGTSGTKFKIDISTDDLSTAFVVFSNPQRVSFSGSVGSRQAVLNFIETVYRSNPDNLTFVSGQLRWYENDRTEVDVTLNDGASDTTYSFSRSVPMTLNRANKGEEEEGTTKGDEASLLIPELNILSDPIFKEGMIYETL